ncbi:MAG: DNA polymerase III subunit gamma/tau [Pirellulales bacterium]
MAAAPDNRPEPALTPDDSAAPTGASYVVVARRYRPQTFHELVGQEHIAKALVGAIQANRVGHAYLFTGARGVGKTSAARILAKALNCETGPTATPCNHCDICESIAAGNDVDVLEIDGASNRGIDEIRQLRQNVGIRPSRARYKIYIIDEVHMLTREAFNALLKTLEEPPEHVKFIFCTTEAAKIPITILSRCQRFDFAGIGQRAIMGRLEQIVAAEGAQVEEEALAILARRAAGSMRDSQSLLEQLLAFGGETITAAQVHAMLGTAGETRLATLVDHLAKRDPAGAIGDLDEALAEGVDVGQLVEQLLGYFRDVLLAAAGCGPDILLHNSSPEHPRLAAAGRELGLETVLAIMQILDHTLARMRYSTQGRTLAEMALVRIANLENLDDLSEMIAGLRECNDDSPHEGAPARGRSTPVSTPLAGAKKKGDLSSGAVNDTGAIDDTGAVDETGDDAGLGPAQSSRAAAPLEVTDENVAVIWKEALAGLTDLLGENAAKAESVTLVAPGRLVATFRAKYTSCKTYCERAPQRATLETALAEVAGQRLAVEFRTLDDAGTDQPAPRTVAPQRQRMAEVAENPLVRRTSELFGASLVRVEGQGGG